MSYDLLRLSLCSIDLSLADKSLLFCHILQGNYVRLSFLHLPRELCATFNFHVVKKIMCDFFIALHFFCSDLPFIDKSLLFCPFSILLRLLNERCLQKTTRYMSHLTDVIAASLSDLTLVPLHLHLSSWIKFDSIAFV